MAMIITLDRIADSTVDEAIVDSSCREQVAEVILFPGVRYERWSDEPATSGAPSELQRKRELAQSRRDWLDI
ncbi:MAG: hypothetical protein JXQ99_17390 [Hyphomicrobiaceae bacterium]